MIWIVSIVELIARRITNNCHSKSIQTRPIDGTLGIISKNVEVTPSNDMVSDHPDFTSHQFERFFSGSKSSTIKASSKISFKSSFWGADGTASAVEELAGAIGSNRSVISRSISNGTKGHSFLLFKTTTMSDKVFSIHPFIERRRVGIHRQRLRSRFATSRRGSSSRRCQRLFVRLRFINIDDSLTRFTVICGGV